MKNAVFSPYLEEEDIADGDLVVCTRDATPLYTAPDLGTRGRDKVIIDKVTYENLLLARDPCMKSTENG